jgi:hypothetical protein
MTRLGVSVGVKEFNSHSFYSMPGVVNNITRTEALQLDLSIGKPDPNKPGAESRGHRS